MKKGFIRKIIVCLVVIMFTHKTFAFAEYSKKEVTTIGSPRNLGFKNDGNGIKYYYEDGKFYRDCWQWIDNNNDGLYECYYFNLMGHIFTNGITPSGYEVNEKGQLKIDGVVQHKALDAIFDMNKMPEIKRKKVEVKKEVNENGKEVIKEMENELLDVLEQGKEELISKLYSKDYNRKEMKGELSKYIDEFDKVLVKYYKELSKILEDKKITKSMFDTMHNEIDKVTSKYKNKLIDYINPYIDDMINYEID